MGPPPAPTAAGEKGCWTRGGLPVHSRLEVIASALQLREKSREHSTQAEWCTCNLRGFWRKSKEHTWLKASVFMYVAPLVSEWYFLARVRAGWVPHLPDVLFSFKKWPQFDSVQI